jgi:PIN domain nuclease of toxin-antitoxin system
VSWRSARRGGRALVVFDSWALLAYLKDEPAAAQIEEAPGGLSYADAFCVATAQRLDAPYGPAIRGS